MENAKNEASANAEAAAVLSKVAAASKEAAGITKRSSAFFVDPDTVTIDPDWNIRVDMGDLDELAASIKAELERDPNSGGLVHPIGVRRLKPTDPLAQAGKFLFAVQWGHRRTTSIQMLRKKGIEFPVGIPAKIVDKGQDQQHALIQMFIENMNEPLKPIEEAMAYKRLRDGDAEAGVKGMTLNQICQAVGRSKMHVGEMLALLEAAPEVQEAVKKGEIGKQTAKLIARKAKGDADTQRQLTAAAKAARKGDKNARVQLAKGLDKVARDKAAKRGKTIKMRALSDIELGQLGAKVAEHMAELMTNAGKPLDTDLRKWVTADDKLALAATFGALEALKAAAGMDIKIKF